MTKKKNNYSDFCNNFAIIIYDFCERLYMQEIECSCIFTRILKYKLKFACAFAHVVQRTTYLPRQELGKMAWVAGTTWKSFEIFWKRKKQRTKIVFVLCVLNRIDFATFALAWCKLRCRGHRVCHGWARVGSASSPSKLRKLLVCAVAKDYSARWLRYSKNYLQWWLFFIICTRLLSDFVYYCVLLLFATSVWQIDWEAVPRESEVAILDDSKLMKLVEILLF